DTALHVELADGLRQAEVPLGDEVHDVRPLAAELEGDLDDEAQVRRNQSRGGFALAGLLEVLGEPGLLLDGQNLDVLQSGEIDIERGQPVGQPLLGRGRKALALTLREEVHQWIVLLVLLLAAGLHGARARAQDLRRLGVGSAALDAVRLARGAGVFVSTVDHGVPCPVARWCFNSQWQAGRVPAERPRATLFAPVSSAWALRLATISSFQPQNL